MIRHSSTALVLVAASALASSARAQTIFPNDFEPGSPMLDPVSSYFGGVASFGVQASNTTIHSGRSLNVWANFQHDTFFHIAGFQVGTLSVPRAQLAFPASADTFSVTVRPPGNARLQMIVSIREDDDGDGLLDSESDDYWETAPILLGTTTQVYNIPVSSFVLSNPGSGNGIRQFASAPRLGIVLTFETRASLPGGIVEAPVSFHIDHLGLYAGNQSLPAPSCPADLDNGSGLGQPDAGVDINDLLFFLGVFEAGDVRGDLDNGGGNGVHDNAVTIDDLLFFLVHFEAGC